MPIRPSRAVALLGFCAVLFAQTAPPASPQTGTVEGDVVESVTNRPISSARVRLQAGERVFFTTCDAKGHFQFVEVPFGRYSAAADRQGYLPVAQATGARVSPDEIVTRLHLSLPRAAVIAGKVTDSAGVPMEGVTVDLLQSRPIDPRPGVPAAVPPRRVVVQGREMFSAAGTTTNDLGEYRFGRLTKGIYYVSARSRSHRDDTDESERITYYPRTLHAALARPVGVAAGQEAHNVDIQLIRQAGVRISGRLIQPANSPQGRTILVHTNVVAWRQDGLEQEERMLASSADEGVFELKNFLPGQYVVEALTSDQTDFARPHPLLAGRRTVEVRDKDVEGVEIAMQPPVDIRGTVVFEENCPAVPVSVVTETSSRLASVPRQVVTGAFTLPSLVPGKYTLTIRPQPSGAAANCRYSVDSAKLGEHEILQAGFEIAGQPAGALRIAVACTVQSRSREVVR